MCIRDSNESNMEVNQEVTSEGLTENSSVVVEIESDSVKKQFNQSSMKNVSYKRDVYKRQVCSYACDKGILITAVHAVTK